MKTRPPPTLLSITSPSHQASLTTCPLITHLSPSFSPRLSLLNSRSFNTCLFRTPSPPTCPTSSSFPRPPPQAHAQFQLS
ncbi:hypothetical protein E2C01_056752 [Portunus trituberculatus]|uniref:Uncharacterized protein n=1 Tax=Portunus trituberculatus TaxID=210409 RepID=A0A5B7GYA2_PORTR|nr:hypothetical protein [Portunus trituberculatus]